jgi:hypothetical protein
MATVQPAIEEQLAGSTSPAGTSRITWSGMANGDVGAPVRYHSHADRSVQVAGVFGTGGTVLIEGSVDEANFATLSDPQGIALSLTAAKVKAISEMTTVVRPRVSAGDGTTALTVTMIVRRQP